MLKQFEHVEQVVYKKHVNTNIVRIQSVYICGMVDGVLCQQDGCLVLIALPGSI